MKIVTDRTSNPFGMRPPCDDAAPVFGYGDANADFHLIGDHPGVHGGATTGIPFTGAESGDALQGVFRDAGFISGPRDEPALANLFLSYLHMCPPPDGECPPPASYDRLERYFDAELRAINAHILLPVGRRATDHVLRAYTTQRDRIDLDMAALHATDVRGRGFMIVPIRDPASWEEGDRERLGATLDAILASDYRQTKGVATLVG